mmetsp:Transcript_4387/g.16536  ORF Transcript_4387/g.16536 Transcript_4387/m.16536 type:complete len:496 (+) Transcript_4387:438-1925(+)
MTHHRKHSYRALSSQWYTINRISHHLRCGTLPCTRPTPAEASHSFQNSIQHYSTMHRPPPNMHFILPQQDAPRKPVKSKRSSSSSRMSSSTPRNTRTLPHSSHSISNRSTFQKLTIDEHWTDYVLQFGPCKEKNTGRFARKSHSKLHQYRMRLPYRADDPENETKILHNLPEDHHLHKFYSTTHDLYYNPKTGVRNDARHIALSIRAKERQFYSLQNVDPLLLHAFTQVPIKKIAHVTTKDQIPQPQNQNNDSVVLPNECIVCGRSNVGKSSIINAIVKRPLMLTSIKPGKTQQLHFYRIGRILTLVDLPGYGFAHGVDESLVQQWSDTINHYITTRGDRLKMVFLLVDSRHGFKENDLAMVRNLELSNVPYSVVFTKTDLDFPDVIAKRLYLACQQIGKIKFDLLSESMLQSNANDEIARKEHVPSMESIREKFLMVSSVTQSGIGKLRASMQPFMYLKKIQRRLHKENHTAPQFLTLDNHTAPQTSHAPTETL